MAIDARVVILSLGGTITMANGSANAGLRPMLHGSDLSRALSVSGDQIVTEEIAKLPGSALTFADIERTYAAALRFAVDGAAGIVVSQGTDTLEESAYLLDLWWPRNVPLVVTGAMRGADELGADGPANIHDAIVLARHPSASRLGVLVTMGGEIHAARHVRKTDSVSLTAFKSPHLGPLGVVREEAVILRATIDTYEPIARPSTDHSPHVPVVESVLGDEGPLLESLLNADVDGLVLSAFGVGHVSPESVESLSKLALRIPVVFSSRAESGGTGMHTYGFEGSEMDLIARGLIPSGMLDARKARILLCALVAAGASRDEVADQFARRGQR